MMSGYPPEHGYYPDSEASVSSTDNLTTGSRGFEYIDSDEKEGDTRVKMESSISKIANAVPSAKKQLVYSTDDLIEETTLNVGPQHNLEDEIKKKIQTVQKAVTLDSEVNDSIPNSVLQKLSVVMEIAKEGNASTFTASTTFDTTNDAFEYGRSAATNTFDLKRGGKRKLEEFDNTFLSMIESQINWEMDRAEKQMEDCFGLLDQAKRETKIDNEKLYKRQTDENQLVGLQDLEEIHSAANEDLQEEEREFTDIKEKCRRDVNVLDQNLQNLTEVLDTALNLHQSRQRDRANKLAINRAEQDDLRKRLRQLEAEEAEYVRVEEEENFMMEKANIQYNEAEGELIEYRERILALGKQAKASLEILDVMKNCTDEILMDAKERKTEWRERLDQLELESLLNTRDVIVATVCLHKMEEDDCSRNLQDTKDEIQKKNAEINEAVKRRFKEKVEMLKDQLTKFEETKELYTEKLKIHKDKMQELNDELASVTGRIKDLDPRRRLTSVDAIYKERSRVKDDCFESRNIEEARKKLHSCTI